MTAKDLQIRELKDIIIDQKQLISALNSALASSNAQSEQLTAQIKLLNEQLEYLKKKLFGTSSERRAEMSEDQISLFNEAEEFQSEVIPEIEAVVKSHTRKPKKTLSEKINGIPVQQVICDIDGDKLCGQCGTDLVKIGQEIVRRELSRATMANWVIYSASHYLKPLYDYFHRMLLKREFLMADETRVQVLKEDGRSAETDSFMWLYRSGEDGLAPIILYKYSPTRAGYNAADFLKGYKGYLMTDGFAGYNKLAGVKRCCCWAHIRRYFIESVPKGHEYDLSKPSVQGVEFCTKLFKIEEEIRVKGLDHEARKAIRLQKAKPVLKAFWSWVSEQLPTRNTRFHKALVQAAGRKPYLDVYLEDGRCSLSNNLSENAIRPFTIGRKGWLICDTPAGAESSAIVYSIVEMAKANGLNIYNYLNYILTHQPSPMMSDDQLETLAPWNEVVKQNCSSEMK